MTCYTLLVGKVSILPFSIRNAVPRAMATAKMPAGDVIPL
jgi:hypothetical protein